MDKKIDLTKITHNAYVDQYFSKNGIYCNGGLSECDKRCIFNLTRNEKLKLNGDNEADADVQCLELKYALALYHDRAEAVAIGNEFMIKYPHNVPIWVQEAMKRYISEHPEEKL